MSDKYVSDTLPIQGVSVSTLPPFVADDYLHHVEGYDFSEEQKVEFLRTLWWIMAAFVDMGFDVAKAPVFIPELGKLSSEFPDNALQKDNPTLAREFDGAALKAAEEEEEDAE